MSRFSVEGGFGILRMSVRVYICIGRSLRPLLLAPPTSYAE